MGLLAFLFRAFLFLVVFRLAAIVLRAFLGGVVQGSRPPGPSTANPGSPFRPSPAPRGQVEELVKDPICGVHTAKSSALAGTFQGAPAWFCSPQCAQKAAAA